MSRSEHNTLEIDTISTNEEEYHHSIQKKKWKEYNNRPEVLERRKKQRATNEAKAKQRERNQTDDKKQKDREYHRKPEIKEKQRSDQSFRITMKRATRESYIEPIEQVINEPYNNQ